MKSQIKGRDKIGKNRCHRRLKYFDIKCLKEARLNTSKLQDSRMGFLGFIAKRNLTYIVIWFRTA